MYERRTSRSSAEMAAVLKFYRLCHLLHSNTRNADGADLFLHLSTSFAKRWSTVSIRVEAQTDELVGCGWRE